MKIGDLVKFSYGPERSDDPTTGGIGMFYKEEDETHRILFAGMLYSIPHQQVKLLVMSRNPPLNETKEN
jgi:hypothetical protein